MTTVGPDAGVAAKAVRPVAPWRQVAIPTEHGGWSLTAEPVVLGLLVAWSWPGAALGVAAMLAFVARTPLKLGLVDRWRHRWLDRSRLALRIACLFYTSDPAAEASRGVLGGRRIIKKKKTHARR